MRQVMFAIAMISLLAPNAYSAMRSDIREMQDAIDSETLDEDREEAIADALERAAAAAEEGNSIACMDAVRKASALLRG